MSPKVKILILVGILLGIYSTHLQNKAAYQASLDPYFHAQIDGELNFDEAVQVALYLDSLKDQLKPVKLDITEGSMEALILEIVPQFEYEGAVDQAVYPTFAEYSIYYGFAYNHVLGRSNCSGFTINIGYINPFSHRYGDPGWMSTVVHELVHVQQGDFVCSVADIENIENTAEVVSYEVMAGEVNRGNSIFIYPLLDELTGRANMVVLSRAIKENRMDDYWKFQAIVEPLPSEMARADKAFRFWKQDPVGLQDMLNKYAEQPFNRIIYAITQNHGYITDLALPTKFGYGFFVYPPTYGRTILLDDLSYFLLHAQNLIEEVNQ